MNKIFQRAEAHGIPRCTRAWLKKAMSTLSAELNRSADTHLIRFDLPEHTGITLYLKDESSHPTGSLKHRLARSLFLYGLCNGKIGPKTTLVEASSGSTAASEAYFAQLLHVRFITVVPKTTSREKIEAIRAYGGQVHFVDDPKTVYNVARDLAENCDGYYLDQFTNAERATDWRSNNNIAESIFNQMSQEPYAVPTWIIAGAGTGGTSATIGRYIRYRGFATQLCVADPEGSVFHQSYLDPTIREISTCQSVIEGIGRARVEPSFLPDVIDRMIAVSDTESLASMRVLGKMLMRQCGGSTGTNIWAVAQIISEMIKKNEKGSVVSLICDGGERYQSTYYNEEWLKEKGFDVTSLQVPLKKLFLKGEPF